MKKTMAIVLLFGIAWCASGQTNSYNPYLVQGTVAPRPMSPAEFGGTGTLSMDVGNTGSTDIALVPGQEMLVTVTLSYGVPDNPDPLLAVTGAGAAWFSWQYFSATRTYRGTQITTIPGLSRETISIAYRVVENSFSYESYKNGFNANLSPPGYTNPQPTDDDTVAAYTYVQASDYGDAPGTYGAAVHTVDLRKDVDGFYEQYMFLGGTVDPETNYLASAGADGDDTAGADDEDGVTFPALVAGTTVTVPVTMTIVDGDQTGYAGKLSAWFDWNGDGDFTDAGERAVTNMNVDFEVLGGGAAGTVNLQVTVPSTATAGQTFARFRFGPSLLLATAPYRSAAYGEVEDYRITLQAPPQPVTVGDRVWEDLNGNGVQDGGEPGLTNVTVRLLDATNGVAATAVTDVNGNYLFANRPAATYKVEVVPPARYVFTTRDAAAATDLADSDADLATGRTDPVVMAAGSTNLTLDAGLYVPAVLHGYVFRDANGDLLRSQGDSSLTNVRVRLLVGGVEFAATNSNEFGYYRFGGVPAGTVSVLVSRVGGTLTGVPAQEPDVSDEARNRALPDGSGVDAFIAYTVVSGQGVLAERPAETLNFGFVTKPLSTALDVSLYTSSEGVMIELWTENESGTEDIVVFAWLNNAWSEVGRVPSLEIAGDGSSNKYVVRAEGLAPDGAYLLKVVDESGHEHLSPLPVAVRTLRVEAVRLDLQTLTLAFNTEAGRPYVVKVSTNLVHWTTEYVSYPTAQGWSGYRNTPFTAGGASTQVRVPVNGRKQAYFKIERVE